MTESECLFCRMSAGSVPVEKLHEDDLVFAINDIHPRAPTHILVIPSEHIPSVRAISSEQGALLAHMVVVANELADRLSIGERGYRLAFNVGEEGGQTIYHLHLHLLGGRRLGPEG